MSKYGFYELVKTGVSLIITKIFYKSSRLIRFPIYIRFKKSIVFGKGLTTGYDCRIECGGKEKNLYFGDDIRLGDLVHIVAVQSVKIGNDCLFASNIFVSDCDHGSYIDSSQDINIHPKDRPLYSSPVIIGDDCWIGENVCILKGSKIGSHCIIGANTIVNSEIPDYSIVVGQPGRVIKRYNKELCKWEKISGRK